jgi:ubiquinone/menaquinone biosynthesis C-methylase UbiE
MGADAIGWWRSYFGEDFFALHEALFPEAASRAEVAGMRELLALPWGARVLDVPCGWGRHTRLLAEAGCQAHGADLSLPLLRHAVPGQGRARAHYTAADVRFLPYADAAFDAVLNVFTSLGLFLDDAQDLAALREAHRVLRPGGAFLLESMHRDDVVAAYAERDAWSLPDGTEVRVRRRFDPVTGISHERLRWRRGSETGRKEHALRLRTATEIAALLRGAGFHDVAYYGDWTGNRLRHDSQHLLAVARKSA